MYHVHATATAARRSPLSDIAYTVEQSAQSTAPEATLALVEPGKLTRSRRRLVADRLDIVKSERPDTRPRFRRRSGVIWRPSQLGVPEHPQRGSLLWPTSWVNDGGDDAPLTSRGRLIYRSALVGIVVVFVVLVLLTARGY